MHRKFVVIVAGAASLLASPALAQMPADLPLPDLTPASAEEEAAALAWLGKAAMPFDPSAYDASTLAPLAERLGSARVIGIGEATTSSGVMSKRVAPYSA